MDPNEELEALSRRRTALETRIALGRDLTPASGPDGSLTPSDLATIATDPMEYELRREEIHEALTKTGGTR